MGKRNKGLPMQRPAAKADQSGGWGYDQLKTHARQQQAVIAQQLAMIEELQNRGRLMNELFTARLNIGILMAMIDGAALALETGTAGIVDLGATIPQNYQVYAERMEALGLTPDAYVIDGLTGRHDAIAAIVPDDEGQPGDGGAALREYVKGHAVKALVNIMTKSRAAPEQPAEGSASDGRKGGVSKGHVSKHIRLAGELGIAIKETHPDFNNGQIANAVINQLRGMLDLSPDEKTRKALDWMQSEKGGWTPTRRIAYAMGRVSGDIDATPDDES